MIASINGKKVFGFKLRANWLTLLYISTFTKIDITCMYIESTAVVDLRDYTTGYWTQCSYGAGLGPLRWGQRKRWMTYLQEQSLPK